MDLLECGTEGDRLQNHSDEAGRDDSKRPWRQWRVVKPGVFAPNMETRTRLPAGGYDCLWTQGGEIQLVKKDLKADDLLMVDDSLPAVILREIEQFWTQAEKFRRYGFLHRRGYLLYGPQGCGKSSVVHQIVQQIIRLDHVAIFCDDPGNFNIALDNLRSVEPDRPVVCVFEDIDAIIENYGDAMLLQWLDGSHQIDRVVNLATTNYPDKLDDRIICRPRRFDRIIKIEAPSSGLRRAYFARVMPERSADELQRWVDASDGLSFASLAELVISVACLGNGLEETIQTLRKLEDEPPTSRECHRQDVIGFRYPQLQRNGTGE